MHLRGDEQALPMVVKTLDEMAAGGMYDLVGGGFHRCSVDRTWLVPHFEKMLYDNALLASAYLHAWLSPARSGTAGSSSRRSTTCCASSPLPEGAFASAQDADTEGVEGLTFTWTAEEECRRSCSILRGRPLDHPRRARTRTCAAAFSSCASSAEAAARRQGDRVVERPAAGRAGRSGSPAAAFGLARCRFTAGRVPARALSDDEGRLYRTFREGRAKNTGFLDDYADVANGLYELRGHGELRWLVEANRLARLAIELFGDEERGGFFLTPNDGERLVARQKVFDDHPTPSGNSMLAFVLLGWRGSTAMLSWNVARSTSSRLVHDALPRAPQAFGHALSALDLHFTAARAGNPSAGRQRGRARGARAVPSPASSPSGLRRVPLLEGEDKVDGLPAVYVCENFAAVRLSQTLEASALEPFQSAYKPLTDARRLQVMMAGMKPRDWGLAAASAALTLSALLAVAGGGVANASPQRVPRSRTSSS